MLLPLVIFVKRIILCFSATSCSINLILRNLLKEICFIHIKADIILIEIGRETDSKIFKLLKRAVMHSDKIMSLMMIKVTLSQEILTLIFWPAVMIRHL